MTEHLRFAPAILARLGEELIPHADQGILELVRNAYDADAPSCDIELLDVQSDGGSVVVQDRGAGMNRREIREGWMVLGRSIKDPAQKTPRYNRLPVGEKGLGRLAALRLGRVATVRTRPIDEPGVEYELEFVWDEFDAADTVDDVGLQLRRRRTKESHGTTIELTDLRSRLTRPDVKRLARAILLLADPFASKRGFRVRLSASEFEDLEHLVERGYRDYAAYEIKGSLGSTGLAKAEMIDHRTGDELTGDHDAISERHHDGARYEAPQADLRLWVFPRSGETIRDRTTAATVGGLREWLDVVGGVHIYHRGLRVYPYGDPGYDWIDMNRMRAASPEERPSTNNSVGRVRVSDPKARLRQKTDRTGFIEDDAFFELRAFTHDVVDWAGRERLRLAEVRRERSKRRTKATVETAGRSLEKAVQSVPPSQRRDVEKARKTLERATSREFTKLSDELQLYRTLGTIGATTAVVAHEAFAPARLILRMAKSVEKRGQRLLDDRYAAELGDPVDLIHSSAERLVTLTDLPGRFLDRAKRRRHAVPANEAIQEVLDILKPILAEHEVELETELDGGNPRIDGTAAALESIVGNLVTNAVTALDRKPVGQRRLRVRTESDNGSMRLVVADSGPGIRKLGVETIWLPGETTTKNGVGLGLTIVRDAVADLSGNVTAKAKGDLGGAEFTVELPVAT